MVVEHRDDPDTRGPEGTSRCGVPPLHLLVRQPVSHRQVPHRGHEGPEVVEPRRELAIIQEAVVGDDLHLVYRPPEVDEVPEGVRSVGAVLRELDQRLLVEPATLTGGRGPVAGGYRVVQPEGYRPVVEGDHGLHPLLPALGEYGAIPPHRRLVREPAELAHRPVVDADPLDVPVPVPVHLRRDSLGGPGEYAGPVEAQPEGVAPEPLGEPEVLLVQLPEPRPVLGDVAAHPAPPPVLGVVDPRPPV